MSDPVQEVESLPSDPVGSAMGLALPGIGKPIGDAEQQLGHTVQNWWNNHLSPEALEPGIHANLEQLAQEQRQGKISNPAAGVGGRAGFERQQLAPSTDESQIQQEAQTGSQVVSQAADPMNYLMLANPETLAAKLALFSGVPAAQQMLSSDPQNRNQALMWAGITGGLMGLGHLGPLKDAVKEAVPGIGDMLGNSLKLNDLASRIAANPFGRNISPYLEKRLAAANEELKKRPEASVQAEPKKLKPNPRTGEIKITQTAEEGKARKALLKGFGVKDEAGLKNYIALRGGLTPEESDWLVRSYKNTLFRDPILGEDVKPGEYVDPQTHFNDIKAQSPEAYTQATRATALFNTVLHLVNGGTMGHENIALGLMRGLVGTNHALDFFVNAFADTLGKMDPKINWDKLAEIAELGGTNTDEYQALNPTEKFGHDMYRLLANVEHAVQVRAGMKTGQVGSYVPRIAESLPMTQGRGGFPKRVLTDDFNKSREWRVEAVPKFTSVSPADVAPLVRQLGKAGQQLSFDAMAHLHQVTEAMNDEDVGAIMQSLRDMKTPNAMTKSIEALWEGMQDGGPDSLRLRMVPAFKTIGEVNKHLAKRRDDFVDALLHSPTDAERMAKADGGLAGFPLDDPEVMRIIKEQDVQAAKTMAAKIFTPMRTNLLDIIRSGHFTRGLKAAQSQEAVQELEKTVVALSDGTSGMAAVRFPPNSDDRAYSLWLQRGYRQAKAAPAVFRDYLFAPEIAKFVERASQTRSLGWTEKLYQLEKTATQLIMFNPLYHGMNMIGRAMAYGMGHPVDTVHWIKNGGAIKTLSPLERERARLFQQAEAYAHGMVTPSHARTMASDTGSGLANTFGDETLHALGVNQKEPLYDRLKGVPGLGKVLSFQDAANRMLWNKINDFGTMVYHIELEAQKRRGIPAENAARYAARRANTWMGHVSELDHNPDLHGLSRLAVFAPNYWRTFGELMMPVYRGSGIQFDKKMNAYIMRDMAKTVMSLLAVQKLTGNALNWTASGHWQSQNAAGHQDQIEVSRPELVGLLKWADYPGAANIDATLGIDPATGGRMYLTNPFARQQFAAEQVGGRESGYSDWQLQDALHGSQKMLAARLSPLADALGSLANVDLYNSISTGTIRNVNPDHWNPDGWNAAFAVLAMTPLGLNNQNLARTFSNTTTDPQTGQANQPFSGVQGPFGTTIPKFAHDMIKGASPGNVMLGVLSSLTGVNPPYESPQKSRGQQLSDDDYRNIAQLDQKYQQNLQNLSNQALTAQITPSQWYQDYHQLSAQHRAELQYAYKNSPDYTEGSKGLAAQYDALYTDPRALDPQTGVLDPDKLAQLQGQFKSQHSQAEISAMNAELNTNVQKNPALKLYTDTLNQYYQWQGDWAAQRGISQQKLQDELRQYSALYSDQRASQHFLAQHPEVRQFETAKRNIWERSPQGQLYGSYFQSSTVGKLLQQEGLTPQQLLQQRALAAQPGGVSATGI